MFDRLITNDYSHSGVETLMLDRKSLYCQARGAFSHFPTRAAGGHVRRRPQGRDRVELGSAGKARHKYVLNSSMPSRDSESDGSLA